MTKYTEALEELTSRTVDAYLGAVDAVKAADNEDGAPVDDLRAIKKKLDDIHRDLNSLCDHGMTRRDMQSARALYEGAKVAGLV